MDGGRISVCLSEGADQSTVERVGVMGLGNRVKEAAAGTGHPVRQGEEEA